MGPAAGIRPEKSAPPRLTHRWGWLPSWNGGRHQSGEITPASATASARPVAPPAGACTLPGLSHGLARSAILETGLTLAIIPFCLSASEGSFEVVRPRRLGPDHGQHA